MGRYDRRVFPAIKPVEAKTSRRGDGGIYHFAVYRRRATDRDYLVSVLEKIIRDDDVLAQSNLVRLDDRLLIACRETCYFNRVARFWPGPKGPYSILAAFCEISAMPSPSTATPIPRLPMAGPIRRIGNCRPPAPSRSPIFYAVRGMARILPRLDSPIVCLRDCRMCRTRIGNGWDVASISWFWKRSGGSDVVAPWRGGSPRRSLASCSCHFRHWLPTRWRSPDNWTTVSE